MRAGLARDADHPALRLEDEVEGRAIPIGAVLAEARDGTVDDSGVSLPRFLVGQAEAREGARAVVLEHDVAPLDELEEELLALGALEVDLDAFLVAVEADEVRGLAAGQRRSPRARDVARASRLELDHLRPEVGEHGGAEGSRERVAEVEHPDVLQRHLHQRPPATASV